MGLPMLRLRLLPPQAAEFCGGLQGLAVALCKSWGCEGCTTTAMPANLRSSNHLLRSHRCRSLMGRLSACTVQVAWTVAPGCNILALLQQQY